MTFQQEIPQVEDLKATMERYGERGCAIGLCFANGFPAWHHFSYAPEFLRQYEDLELAKTDATLARGFSEDGVFLWSELEAEGQMSKTMQVAQKFGMMDGICFAETVNGFKSIASVSLTDTAQAKTVPVDEILEKMQLASIAVSKAVTHPQVSPKALEYLRLAALGKRDEEIAEDLGLSISGARRRRQTAVSQIGAKTLVQAVGFAASLGLIRVYQNV